MRKSLISKSFLFYSCFFGKKAVAPPETKAPPEVRRRWLFGVENCLLPGLGVDRARALDREGVVSVGRLGDHARLGEVDGLAVAEALALEQDFVRFALQLPRSVDQRRHVDRFGFAFDHDLDAHDAFGADRVGHRPFADGFGVGGIGRDLRGGGSVLQFARVVHGDRSAEQQAVGVALVGIHGREGVGVVGGQRADGDGVHRGVGDESREGFGGVVSAGCQAAEGQDGNQGFDVFHGVGIYQLCMSALMYGFFA